MLRHTSPDLSSDRAAVRAAGPVGLARHQLDGRVRLPPGAVEQLSEQLRRLSAGDAVLAVDDEERHAGRAVGLRLLDVRVYVGRELLARQDRVDALGRQPGA